MKIRKRYYTLKKRDGWHVMLETQCDTSYQDFLDKPVDEKTAKGIVEQLEREYAGTERTQDTE